MFGVVILQDHRPVPGIPRWVGYVCVWAGLLFSPGSFLVFFKDGPMAWNGLLVFWVPIGSFLVWMVAVVMAMLRATAAAEPAPERPTDLRRELDEVRAELGEVRIRLAELSEASAG